MPAPCRARRPASEPWGSHLRRPRWLQDRGNRGRPWGDEDIGDPLNAMFPHFVSGAQGRRTVSVCDTLWHSKTNRRSAHGTKSLPNAGTRIEYWTPRLQQGGDQAMPWGVDEEWRRRWILHGKSKTKKLIRATSSRETRYQGHGPR